MKFITRLFTFILILVTIFHLWSIDLFIQSWSDLVVLHDVTISFINGDGFFPQSNPLFNGGREMVIYGPVYFILEGLAILIGGNSHFTASFVGVMFLFPFAWLILKYIKNKYGALLGLGMLLLLYTDAQLMTAFHNGRMEIMACFFSLYLFFIGQSFSGSRKEIILSSLAASMAFLTTPRVAVIMIPTLIYLTGNILFVRKDVKSFVVLISIPTILVTLWIFFGFGGFSEVYNYFFIQETNHLNKTGNMASKFIGGNFQVQRTQYVLFTLTFVSLLLLVYKRGLSILKEKWILLSLSTIILYYLLIVDFGNYSALLISVVYYLFIRIINELTNVWQRTSLFLLLGHNLLLFGVMASNVIVSYPYNSSDLINSFISRNIESTAKVSGHHLYYFGALENGNEFRTWSKLEINVDENERQIFKEIKVDYLILKEFEFRQIDQEKYQLKLEKIDELDLSKYPYQDWRELLKKYKLGGDYLHPQLDFSGTIIYKVHYNN